MKTDERVRKIMQKRIRYTGEEIQAFRENPRNADILAKGTELANKVIVLEVVASHGCNSVQKVNDKLYFEGQENLLTERCVKRVCGYLLNSALMMVFAANELIYAGVDPNEMRFKRAGCFDVGLDCGGWGRVVLELRVEDRS